MHSAPSVTYPVGRSRLTGALVLAGAGCGVAATALGAEQAGTLQGFAGAGLAVAIAAGCWAGSRWWRAPAGDLSWDGQGWTWSADGTPDSTAGPRGILVCLDLQTVLLLRQPLGGGASRWFWLERARFPQRWSALRRAVYSPAVHKAVPGAQPDFQKP